MEFTLTEDHLKLLKNMYVGWSCSEFGAPEIDPKRPYGNGDVIGDIHEILTVTSSSSWEEIPEELEEKYNKLHKETETALQIVLNTLSFVPGRYRKIHPYGRDWELIESNQQYVIEVDEKFNNALSDLAERVGKDKEEIINDALNYYENSVNEWEKVFTRLSN
jgi:hypothetical protein